MATCLDIITYAMRQARILGPGKTPKAAEAEEGMIALQSLYDHWRTNGMFGRLCDHFLDTDETAEEGYRYYVPAGLTLTAPTSEYETSCGELRQPRDLALYEVLEAAGTHTAKLYDRIAWVDLLGLTLSDDAPLAGRGAYGLAACLATSGMGMFGGDGINPNPVTARNATAFIANLMRKDGSTQDRGGAEYY